MSTFSLLCQLFKIHGTLIIIELSFAVLNVFGAIAVHSFEPTTLLCLRVLGSLPFALILTLMFDAKDFFRSCKNLKQNFLRLVVCVGLPQAISFSIYHWALFLSSPVNCALLWLAVTPITAFLGMLLNREKRSMLKILGVIFALGGALVTMDLANYNTEGSWTRLLGDFLVLISTTCYACYLLFTKELSDGMGLWTLSTWYFFSLGFWSALAIPPLWFTIGITNTPVIPLSGWTSLILAVLVGTTLPYVLNNWVILNTSSLIIAMYSPVEMVFTALLASFVLNEQLKWQQGVGSTLILLGLVVVSYAKYKEDVSDPQQIQKEEELVEVGTETTYLLQPIAK